MLAGFAWTADLPLSDLSGEGAKKWSGKDNAVRTVAEEPGKGPVLKVEADFTKAAYTWVKRELRAGDLDPLKHKAVRLAARGDEIGALSVTLVYLDGKTEMKFSRELKLGPAWKSYALPFELFTRADAAITAEELGKVSAIMFGYSKSKNPARGGLALAELALSAETEPPAGASLLIDDFSGALKWTGAVSLSDEKGPSGKKTLRFDAGRPEGATLEAFPHDWSAAGILVFDCYSEAETSAQVEVILHSRDEAKKDFSYYRSILKVNWKGWRRVELPFEKFALNREPAGWNKIDRIQLASEGWGHKAIAGTVLYLDRLEARPMTTLLKRTGPSKPVTERHRQDLALIQKRLTETQVPELATPLEAMSESARKALETLGADGSWEDINYADRSRAAWAPSRHLSRIEAMAINWARLAPSREAERKTLKDGVDRALAFWFRRDPQSENWWHNMIGSQLSLQRIGLALDAYLTDEQRAAIVKVLARGKTDGMTGGNLTWTAGCTVVRGVLERKPEVAAEAFELIQDEVRLAPDEDEGVKIDGSFHQHGQQIYNQGYGAGYAVDASRFLYYAAGTAYEFPKDKADVLALFALDGSRWMLYRNVFDYSCRGREITRPVKGFGVSYLAEVCKNLKTQAGPRQGELAAFHAELTNRANSLTGNKFFWKSDYMAHRRAAWMVSVKMLSVRMQSGELVNDEGRKSHLLSDGVSFLYAGDGQAYHNIFPIWDWKHLPGITSEWSSQPPQGPVPSRGETIYAGGVSDGRYGCTGFIHKRGKLSALKSWFFFDDEAVALGAAITGAELPVHTTLDQSLKVGEVIVREGGKERIASGSTTWDGGGLEWIHHRGLGFLPLEKSRLTLTVAAQGGSWKEISGSASGDPLSAEVFTAFLDHGAKAKSAGYRYLLAPGNLEAFRRYAQAVPVRVATNTERVAAVEHPAKGIAGAVFYDGAGVAFSDGTALTTDGPAILLLKREAGSLILSAANPTGRGGILGVTVNRKVSGKSASWEPGLRLTRIRFDLPGGDEAGKTVTERYRTE
ncbi:MAG: hypothetical protein J0L75_07775 [Spirochaetes bacterium]|nr:hypothetical protein [Spirochaetota bacterium]